MLKVWWGCCTYLFNSQLFNRHFCAWQGKRENTESASENAAIYRYADTLNLSLVHSWTTLQSQNGRLYNIRNKQENSDRVQRQPSVSFTAVAFPRWGRGAQAPKSWVGPKFSPPPNCGYVPKFSRTLDTLWPIYSQKISKLDATGCQILRLKCTKFDFRWGYVPHPAGGAYR